MVDEVGNEINPQRVIGACLREANRFERMARKCHGEPESEKVAKKMADMWIDEAARIELEELV